MRQPHGRTLWMDDEVKVASLRHFDEPPAGRTGKGVVHFWAENGGYRAMDVEDIISVSMTPQMHRK